MGCQRACFRPNHLEPVTAAVNNLRGVGSMVMYAQVIHRPLGYAYDENNTQIKNGAHRCRACISSESRLYREKQKAATLLSQGI